MRKIHTLYPILILLGGCADVQVGSPESLWLFWLLPATIAFFVYVFRTKARLLRRFVSSEMVGRLTQGISRQRQYFKTVLILLGLAALILALAEIRYGFTWETVNREGVDIVVALDVSDSMLVEDAETGGKLSRLERAKREIADLLDLLEGDRISLVAFAGTAFVECPLTLDYGAAEIFLDAIDTELIPVKGTDLAQAIEVSLSAFEGGAANSQAVILITDGEDHSGRATEAAQEAKIAGVRIFTIGIGRDEGAPIPDQGGGFRRDRRGEMVLSRLDEPTLQKVALETGGRYVRSVTGDVDLEQIYSQGIKAILEDQELGSKRRQRWEERFQWSVALALVALMLEPLISIRKRQRHRAATPTSVPVLLIGLLIASGVTAQQSGAPSPAASAEPQEMTPPLRIKDPYKAYEQGLYDQAVEGFTDLQVEYPEDPEVALNLGSAHYQMRNFEDADRTFARAALSSDDLLRQEALYNLGNSSYRQGRLQEAVEFYKSALELNPDDEDAKFNLEFVRDEIRRRHEEAQKRQDQQQQQQQDGDDPQDQDQQQQDGEQDSQPQEPLEQDQQPQSEQDSDQDGLPDEVERSGANPTDPANPDSDSDGLADGAEDLNRNGGLDEGETDPNSPDSDGDGVPDGQDSDTPGAGAQASPQDLEGLTPEEAERYLQALEEGRPTRQLPPGVKPTRSEKDW